MPTLQDIAGLSMIETQFAQFRNVCIAPPVFGVALPALLLFFHQTMVAMLFLNIFSDLLVTIFAEPGLCLLVELLVALIAITFILCVPLDHRAGKQQFID